MGESAFWMEAEALLCSMQLLCWYHGLVVRQLVASHWGKLSEPGPEWQREACVFVAGFLVGLS